MVTGASGDFLAGLNKQTVRAAPLCHAGAARAKRKSSARGNANGRAGFAHGRGKKLAIMFDGYERKKSVTLAAFYCVPSRVQRGDGGAVAFAANGARCHQQQG